MRVCAHRYVNQAISRSKGVQKDVIKIPDLQLTLLAKSLAARDTLREKSKGVEPTIEEIAKETGESVSRTKKILEAPRTMKNSDEISFEVASQEDDFADLDTRDALENILKNCPPELQEEAKAWLKDSNKNVGVKKVADKIKKYYADKEIELEEY